MKRVFIEILVVAVVLACLVGSGVAQAPEKPDWREGFRTHDKNNDGKIDRAEFQDWMVDVFFHKDINHKGYLVFEDVSDVISLETFKSRDRNGDGKITIEEFLNTTFQDFALADVNQNGAVTIEELHVYIVKRTSK